jgi:uncharacterized protein (DUF302 family)
MPAEGLITIRSSYGPMDTMNRLEAGVKAKGMAIFARIDHAAGAAEVGMSLRPTELLVFGSPKRGTPLMQSAQTIGIDLPLKVWSGRTRPANLAFVQRSELARGATRAGPRSQNNGQRLSCGS